MLSINNIEVLSIELLVGLGGDVRHVCRGQAAKTGQLGTSQPRAHTNTANYWQQEEEEEEEEIVLTAQRPPRRSRVTTQY